MKGEGRRSARPGCGLIVVLVPWVCVAASAAPPDSAAQNSWRTRVAQPLLALYDAAGPAPVSPGVISTAPALASAPRVDASGRVQIDVHFDCAIDTPLAALKAAGLSPGASVKVGPLCVVEGWSPPSRLAQIATVPGALGVQVPSYARTPVHPATLGRALRAQTRADAASGIDANGVSIMRADQFVAQTGTTGSGAVVGVQSTGVASLALIQGRGELPAVQVLNPSGGSSASSLDEGTVLLEEVHAVAPGASLAFCGPQTFIDYTSCMMQLIDAGATILLDDMAFGPQDLMSAQGSYPQAVDAILAQYPNVALFTVSGNSNGTYWEDAYTPLPLASLGLPPLTCTLNGSTQVDNYVASFNGNSGASLTADGDYFPFVLAWADPYGQNTSNFDLYLYSGGTQDSCYSAASSAATLISIDLYSSYTVYIGTPDASLAGKFLKLWAGGDGLTALAPSTSGSIISPQAFAASAITIGAVNGSDGVGNMIESFSSQGPLSLVFPTPQQLQAPALVAPDGINVDAVGTYFEGYLFPDGNFYGTSAAVPNAGGVAALLRGAFPGLTVPQIKAALQSGATPFGSPDPNGQYGYGRVDAISALNSLLPLPTMSPLPNSTIVGGSSSPALAFTASGLGNLHFSVASSNTALVPAALAAPGAAGISIAPGGCGTTTLTCTLAVTPAIGQVGTASVTVSALDGANRPAPATMLVTVSEPAGPTLTVNSGASQEFTAGAGAAMPVTFALTGTGPLTVTAVSSNTQLLPASGLVLSAGCGRTVDACTLSLTTAAGVAGAASVSIRVQDAYGQSMNAAAMLQVDPGADSGSVSGSADATGHNGGGGSCGWELAWLALLAGGRMVSRGGRARARGMS